MSPSHDTDHSCGPDAKRRRLNSESVMLVRSLPEGNKQTPFNFLGLLVNRLNAIKNESLHLEQIFSGNCGKVATEGDEVRNWINKANEGKYPILDFVKISCPEVSIIKALQNYNYEFYYVDNSNTLRRVDKNAKLPHAFEDGFPSVLYCSYLAEGKTTRSPSMNRNRGHSLAKASRSQKKVKSKSLAPCYTPPKQESLKTIRDMVIICALFMEAEAVRLVFEERFNIQLNSNEEHAYYEGEIQLSGIARNVYITYQKDMGGISTAVTVATIVEKAQVQGRYPLFLMSGICAGDSRYVNLGDVVVASNTMQHDNGKHVKMENEETSSFEPHALIATPCERCFSTARHVKKEFNLATDDLMKDTPLPVSKRCFMDFLLHKYAPKQYNVNEDWIDRCETIMTQEHDLYHHCWAEMDEKGWFAQSKEGTTKLSDRGKMEYHRRFMNSTFMSVIAPQVKCNDDVMASGMAVRADNAWDLVRCFNRKITAIDMEAYSFCHAARTYPRLIVKSVSDFGNHEKDNQFHEYAARSAAVFLIRFIDKVMGEEKK